MMKATFPALPYTASEIENMHLPLQDWVALDEGLRRPDFMEERINQPADSNHHWRYRFHLPLSVLTDEKASELNVQIEGLLKDSGRYVK